MIVKIDVAEQDVMNRDEVMEKIAKAQDWTITAKPDCGTDEDYRIADKNNREGTYSVSNDEIEWDDGSVGSLFCDYEGNKDFTGGSLLEFLAVTTAVWGTTGDGENDEELVLYVEY